MISLACSPAELTNNNSWGAFWGAPWCENGSVCAWEAPPRRWQRQSGLSEPLQDAEALGLFVLGFFFFTLRAMACVGKITPGSQGFASGTSPQPPILSLKPHLAPGPAGRTTVLRPQWRTPPSCRREASVRGELSFSSSPEIRDPLRREASPEVTKSAGGSGSGSKQPRRRCNPFRQFGHRSTCVPKPLASTIWTAAIGRVMDSSNNNNSYYFFRKKKRSDAEREFEEVCCARSILTGCAAEPGTCRLLGCCCCCCCCPPSGPVVLHSGTDGNRIGRLEITTRCTTTTNHKFSLKNHDFLARLPFIFNHKPQLIHLIDTNIADEGPLSA